MHTNFDLIVILLYYKCHSVVYSVKYARCYVVLCFVLVVWQFLKDQKKMFIDIFQIKFMQRV